MKPNTMTTSNNYCNAEYKKTSSRKWKLVLLILLISTLGTFVPPIICAFFNVKETMSILNGGHFVTLVTLLVSAYFGANVWEKHVLKNQTESSEETESSEVKTENNENGEA